MHPVFFMPKTWSDSIYVNWYYFIHINCIRIFWMDNPRFLYTNIFDEEFLHIVCRFMFLERVLKKKTTMELMLLKNVVCLSFMDSLHWDAFQGFNTADKMSTIFLNCLKTLSPTVFLATTAKERAEIMCWKAK